jgi:peptide/nickel transport system substrate-binding protein
MKSRRFKVFILSISLIAIAAGSAFASSKDTLVFGLDGDPGNAFNPITTGDRYGLQSIKLIYSPLYMYNGPDAKFFFLATSISPSKDFLSYTVKLRKGVKWHDGVAFTADDVVFTYEQMLKEANAGWAYGQLILNDKPVKVSKVDDLTVVFTFPALSAAAEELIANVFILPKHIYEGEQDIGSSPKNAQPIGTGPYKFKSYKVGESLQFEANEDYFFGAPKIKNIVYRVLGNPNAALLALQRGELDAIGGVAPSDAVKLQGVKSLAVLPYEEGRVGYLGFNLVRPAVQNLAVRQAVAYAINRSELIKAAFLSDDFAVPAYSYLPRKAPYFTDKLDRHEFSPTKSKDILAKAKLNGVKLRLAYATNNTVYATQGLVLQQELKAAGIDLELAPIDSSALFKQLSKSEGDFDLFLNGYIMGIDPDTFSSLFVSDSSSNYVHYANPDLDELFNKGRVETSQAKRREIYKKTQEILANDLPFIPLIENKRVLVTTSELQGIKDAALVPIYTFEDSSKLYYK